jgi:Acyl-CoA dehydrogenase, C-terminal domain
MAVRVSENAIRIHGGAGIMRDYPVGRIHRDTLVYVIGEGTSEIQRNLIARASTIVDLKCAGHRRGVLRTSGGVADMGGSAS